MRCYVMLYQLYDVITVRKNIVLNDNKFYKTTIIKGR